MIGEAQCESNDGQRRHVASTGRKHGTAGYIDIRYRMYAAVRVHDSSCRIGMHAGGAHVMPHPSQRGEEPIIFARPKWADDFPETQTPEILIEDLMRGCKCPLHQVTNLP